MGISDYTSIEETNYLWTHPNQLLPYFAPGELTKIENYELAHSEGFYGWVIHHRLGMSMSRWDLMNRNLYYRRPAEELIFLTTANHLQLHHSGTASLSELSRNPQYTKAFHHYRHLVEKAISGESLSYMEERYIIKFCRRKGWELPLRLKLTSVSDRLERNRAICMRLIDQGFLDWDTYRQQRIHILRTLRSMGENTSNNIRAIERMFLKDPKVLQRNGGMPIMKPCTLEDRRVICNNDCAEQAKTKTLERVQALKDKLSAGGRLSVAERKFKSRHNELFK